MTRRPPTRPRLTSLLAAALIWVAAGPAYGNDAGGSETAHSDADGAGLEPSLDQRLVGSDAPAIGDPIELEIRVTHPHSAEVHVAPNLEKSRWTLLETRQSTSKQENSATTDLTLAFQIFRPGGTTLTPQTVRVTDGDRETTLETDPVDVRVESALGEAEDPSFQGPRPPHPVWQRDWTLVWVGGGTFAIAAVVLIVFGLVRRDTDDRPTTPDRPPEAIARERLRELADSRLLEEGDFMVLYVRMSETLRRYLGRRYGFPGAEYTTAEILERLQPNAPLAPEIREDLADWLRQADLVKFSGRIPTTEEAERMLERAIDLVDRTEPLTPAPSDDPDRSDAPDTDETDASPPPTDDSDASDESRVASHDE